MNSNHSTIKSLQRRPKHPHLRNEAHEIEQLKKEQVNQLKGSKLKQVSAAWKMRFDYNMRREPYQR